MKTIILIVVLCVQMNAQISKERIKHFQKLADSIITSALKEETGYKMLNEFCKIGPRMCGSENLTKAIYYMQKRMKEKKFDNVWLQKTKVPRWIRGNKEIAEIIYPEKIKNKRLNISALGHSIGTGNKDITAEVLEVKDFDELKQKSEIAKGKIIFFNRPLDRSKVNTFEGYGGVVNQRSAGSIYAAKYGGLAAIVRSVTTKNDNVTHVGVMYYVDTLPKVPGAAIGSADADYLSEILKKYPKLRLRIKLNCFKEDNVESFNVIGEIKGTEKPEEVIVVGGHIDSWDKGTGAHDDAAGCIHAFEVLDLLNRLNIKTKRTIRCVLFVNEEQGTNGAQTYAEYIDSIKEKNIGAIESDRGGFTPRGFTADCDSLTLLFLQDFIPVIKKAKTEWIVKGGSGVDISKIKKARVLMGFVPDEQRYMDLHHSDNDVFSEIHPRELELGSAAITIMALILSEEL